MDGITEADYKYARRVWKVFQILNECQYHDLYVHRDTLLLEEIFESFQKKCIETCDIGWANFLSVLGLV